MKQIQSGELSIRSEGDGMAFTIGSGDGAKEVRIADEDLPLIAEFIRAHSEARANRRRGYRLDLDQLRPEELAQLRVTVRSEQGAVTVHPADLSITGIRVQSDILEASPGLQAHIELAFEDKSIQLPAVLVRRYDNNTRFAFHFPEIFGDDGRLKPPPMLTEILYALESLWLDKNLDLKWNLA
ncbi:PilZ domain-containing protein [Parahaliea mediterranea]|uniref:PilZ domain-containing protein n=1 Tax=Parahaliea mediterranea TaxID=651086 RepID=UPI000E2EFAF3|nr:PilZ domain-containing protein [Parahaliea mediterranea]